MNKVGPGSGATAKMGKKGPPGVTCFCAGNKKGDEENLF